MYNRRKSNYVELKVPAKGTYHFYICQESARKHSRNKRERMTYQYSDARIILVRKNQYGNYEYIASKFMAGAAHSQLCAIETDLEPGTYLISAKIKWANKW